MTKYQQGIIIPRCCKINLDICTYVCSAESPVSALMNRVMCGTFFFSSCLFAVHPSFLCEFPDSRTYPRTYPYIHPSIHSNLLICIWESFVDAPVSKWAKRMVCVGNVDADMALFERCSSSVSAMCVGSFCRFFVYALT